MNSRKLLIAGMAATALLIFAGCQAEEGTTNPPLTRGKTAEQNASLNVSGTGSGSQENRPAHKELTQQTLFQDPMAKYSEADKAAYGAALQLSDTSFCDKISDAELKNKCRTEISDNMNYAEALQKLDASICLKLSTPDIQQACKISVEAQLKARQNSADTQAQIAGEEKLRDEIIKSGDYTRCKELKVQGHFNECEIDILTSKALSTRDSSWCEKATVADNKDQCMTAYQKMATS